MTEAGRRLFAIQSQDQKRELAAAGFARELLDDVLGLATERKAVAAAMEAHGLAVQRLASRRQEQALADEQYDMWRFQHDELVAADLRLDEEAELSEAIAVKRHARAMLDAASEARDCLDSGATPARELLGRAEATLSPHGDRSSRLAAALEQLTAASELVSEAASELERFLDGFRDDPRDLDELESRKALYEELRRKYRRDVPGLLALADDLHERLGRHASGREELELHEHQVEQARQDLQAACVALHELRVAGAPRVAAAAEASVRPLALPELDVMLEVTPALAQDGDVELAGRQARAAAHGADLVSLKIRTNPGEAAGAAAEIASGGEAARIHLGLTVLRQGRQQPLVWLFDEVDAGLGMDAATPVALLLRQLSGQAQAFCITHLPTVAAHGAQHWRVAKFVRHGRTVLELDELGFDDRVEELARQLGGEGWRQADAAAQTDYARQLLAAAARS